MSTNLETPDNYWFARHSKSIIFSILILTVVGIYGALSLPVAVLGHPGSALECLADGCAQRPILP